MGIEEGGIMKNLGYYNGETGLLDEMKIPMNDRASWFGDGVYDATVAAEHVVYALEEHVDRFFKSASLLRIEAPLSQADMMELLSSLVRKVESPDQFVYWQLTRGTAPRAHVFPEGVKPNLWVTLQPFEMADPDKKIKLITVEDTRFFHCNIKTLNLIPNVLASEQAKEAGCQEAVFHRGERVTECAHSNVHILKDGVFRTAPTDNLILAGIARGHIIEQCGALGIPVEERPFTAAEMMDADEVLVSSSPVFCVSASHIDGRAVGGKAEKLLRQLQEGVAERFRKYIKSHA
jgi:D-alanine transaminase